MRIEPEDFDWSSADDVTVNLAANDGIRQAQAEQRKRAATRKQRPVRTPDAKRPRPLNY